MKEGARNEIWLNVDSFSCDCSGGTQDGSMGEGWGPGGGGGDGREREIRGGGESPY